MTPQRRLPLPQIVAEDRFTQFHHPVPVVALHHEIGTLLQHRQRSRHSHGTFAHAEKGVVIFRVADAHGIMWRQAEVLQSHGHPGGFIHSRRQHHDRSLIEDDVQLKSQIPNDVQHDSLVGFGGGDNRMAHDQRRHLTLLERLDEWLGRRVAQDLFFARRGAVQDRAILHDHARKHVETRKDRGQVDELPARHENQFPAGCPHLLKSLKRLLGHATAPGERTVVIAHEGEIPHSRKNTGGSPPGTTLQRGIARRWFVTQRESACPHV